MTEFICTTSRIFDSMVEDDRSSLAFIYTEWKSQSVFNGIQKENKTGPNSNHNLGTWQFMLRLKKGTKIITGNTHFWENKGPDETSYLSGIRSRYPERVPAYVRGKFTLINMTKSAQFSKMFVVTLLKYWLYRETIIDIQTSKTWSHFSIWNMQEAARK